MRPLGWAKGAPCARVRSHQYLESHSTNVLDQVRERLRDRHPGVRFTDAGGRIVVHPSSANGFDVSIDAGLTVGFDGWHEHFTSPKDALNCFGFGLSDRCRLKVTLRGRVAHKWTVEWLEDGRWIEHSTTGLLFIPFWRAPRVEYRQNAIALVAPGLGGASPEIVDQ